MRGAATRGVLFLVGLAVSATCAEILPAGESARLHEPWTVRLRDGQEIRGRLAGASPDALQFRRILEGGEATVSLERAEIESLSLPGRKWLQRAQEAVRAEDWPAAREILAALYEQRRVALDLLPARQTDLLSFLPRAQLATGATAAALSTAGDLLDHATTPTTLARLREIRLLGHYRLQLEGEARALAEAGRAAGPRYRDSALPDLVLALLAFRAGEVENGLRHCLRPLVFSGPRPPRYLPACYALAIVAAHALGEEDLRDTLDAERRQRGLPWNPPPILAEWPERAPGRGPLPGADGAPLPLGRPSAAPGLPYVPVAGAAGRTPSRASVPPPSDSSPTPP